MANTKAFELGQLARRVEVDSDVDISFSQDIVFSYLGFDSDFSNKTTADLTEGSNLYYTTVRADSDFDVRLTTKDTDDLAEGNNLYYTTTRADSDFDVRLATKDTDDLTEGSNLYYTTVRADSDFDIRLATKDTDDLAEGSNLYYTTARANSDFDTRLATKDTDDLSEGSNLYYTRDRVDSAVADLLVGGTNVNLVYDDISNSLTIIASADGGYDLSSNTTNDLTEGSNLYYTTVRADSDFDVRLTTKDTSDLAEGSNLYYTTARADSDARYAVSAAGDISYDPATGVFSVDVDQIYTQAEFDSDLTQSSTSNLPEGSNLYYTTARADSDFDVRLTTKDTDDLAEGSNLYYTTSRANTDFDTRLATKTTSNLIEGSNLYYTDARADSAAKNAVSATDAGGDGSFSYNNVTGVFTYTGPSASEVRAHLSAGTGVTYSSGQFSIGQPVGTADSVTFSGLKVTNDVVVDGNLFVYGSQTVINTTAIEVTDPMIHLAHGNETSDTIDIGFVGHYSDDGGSTSKHTGIVRDATDGRYHLFENLVQDGLDSSIPDQELNLISVDHSDLQINHLYASGFTGIYQGFDSDFNAKSTSDLSEGSNLYYTQARFDSAFGDKTTTELTEGSNLYYTTIRFDSDFNDKTTSDLAEGANLYYTTARADSDFDVRLATKTTADLTEHTSNKYYTDERVDDRVAALITAGEGLDVVYDDDGNVLSIAGEDASTSNKGVASFNSADFSVTSGQVNIKSLGVTNDQLAGSIANDKLVNNTINVLGNTIALGQSLDFDTDSVAEGSTNQYYLTSRVDSDFDIRLAIKTTDDLTEGNRLYYTLQRFDSAFGDKTTTELTEGSNLYYTQARFDSAFGDKTTSDLTEGTNKYFTNERVDDRIATLVAAGEGIDVAYDDDGNVFSVTGEDASISNKGIASFDNNHFVVSSGNVTIKASSIENDDLAGSIANNKLVNDSITILGNTIALGGSINFNTDSVPEGSTNVYFTQTRARDCLTAVDAGGDGSFTYDSSSGTFTYNGPSASEIRSHFTAGEGIDISSGQVSAEIATSSNKGVASFDETNFVVTSGDVAIATSGVSNSNLAGSITNDKLVNNSIDILGNTIALGESLDFDTDSVAEGSSNLYFTNARADDRIAAVVDSDYVTSRYNSGQAVFGKVVETIQDVGDPGASSIDLDTSSQATFFMNNLSSNLTVNFTNVSGTNDRTSTFNVIVEQGSTAYAVSAVQIGGSAMTVHWIGGEGTIGYANSIDVYTFTLLRVNTSWKVLASVTPYMT